MRIAELFVGVGLQGAELVAKGLGGIKSGFKGIAEASLESKAAVVASIIALERLTGWASQMGLSLHQYNVLTGQSTENLQKWQYAANRFGVSADTVQSSMTSLSDAVEAFNRTGADLPNIGQISDELNKKGLGGIDRTKMRETAYLMEKFRQFAQSAPASTVKNMLTPLVGGEMVLALRQINYEVDKLDHKGFNQRQIKALTDINKQWTDFWYRLKMIGGAWVAAGGGLPVQILNEALNVIIKGVHWLDKMMEKFASLKILIAGLAAAIFLMVAPFAIIQAIVAAVIFALSELDRLMNGKKTRTEEFYNTTVKKAMAELPGLGNKAMDLASQGGSWVSDKISSLIAPTPPLSAVGAGGQNLTANTTQNFYGPVDDPNKVKKAGADGTSQSIRAAAAKNQAARKIN